MSKWKYKSLQWIHEVREKNYEETRDLNIKEMLKITKNKAKIAKKNLGLTIKKNKFLTIIFSLIKKFKLIIFKNHIKYRSLKYS